MDLIRGAVDLQNNRILLEPHWKANVDTVLKNFLDLSAVRFRPIDPIEKCLTLILLMLEFKIKKAQEPCFQCIEPDSIFQNTCGIGH